MRTQNFLIYSLLILSISLSNVRSLNHKKQNFLSTKSHDNSRKSINHDSKSNKNREPIILIQQDATANEQMYMNDFYEDTMGMFNAVKAEELQRLQNTQTQLDNTIKGDAITTAKEVNVLTQEMVDRIQEEEITNKNLVHEANQLITKQINKIKAEQQEIANNVKDSTILSLETQLTKLQERFTEINGKFERFHQNLLTISIECKKLTDCGQCTAVPTCGWCVSEGRCIDGSKSGPAYEVCAFYSYNLCSGSGCLSHKDCNSCLQDTSCGWCGQTSEEENSARCLEKPANYTGCPARQWFHSQGGKPECEFENNGYYDLDAADMLKVLGYNPVETYDDLSLINMESKFQDLKLESDALRERLKSVSEQLKILALERYSGEN